VAKAVSWGVVAVLALFGVLFAPIYARAATTATGAAPWAVTSPVAWPVAVVKPVPRPSLVFSGVLSYSLDGNAYKNLARQTLGSSARTLNLTGSAVDAGADSCAVLYEIKAYPEISASGAGDPSFCPHWLNTSFDGTFGGVGIARKTSPFSNSSPDGYGGAGWWEYVSTPASATAGNSRRWTDTETDRADAPKVQYIYLDSVYKVGSDWVRYRRLERGDTYGVHGGGYSITETLTAAPQLGILNMSVEAQNAYSYNYDRRELTAEELATPQWYKVRYIGTAGVFRGPAADKLIGIVRGADTGTLRTYKVTDENTRTAGTDPDSVAEDELLGGSGGKVATGLVSRIKGAMSGLMDWFWWLDSWEGVLP